MSIVKVSKLHTLIGHKDCLYSLSASSQPNLFFSAGGDGMVVEWDMNQPDRGHLLADLPNSIYALCYVKERNCLIVGQNFEGIHVIDLSSKKEVGSLKLDSTAIFDIKYLRDHLYIACGDGHIMVVNLDRLTVEFREKASDKSARCMAIDPVKMEWAIGFSDHSIKIINLENYQYLSQIPAHGNSVFTLSFVPETALLLSAGRDAYIKSWDQENNYQMKDSIVAHLYAINHLEFSPNGRHFVTCSMDKSIKVWDTVSMKLLKVIDRARHAGHATSVNKLFWSSFQNLLVSCGDDRTISVWDIKINQS